jgi:pimeloyl-ACP methyl ester carboxylesterase
LAEALHLTRFHLFGWSLGGNIVMQYAIDYPNHLRSLTLQAAGSPYGFGGTKGLEGSPVWPDFAGSGGGTANPDFAERIRNGDRGNDQNSPRTVINTFYFKPPFHVTPDREEMYLDGLLSTKVSPANYPGDLTTSEHWPTVAPGTQGVNNALSPKYLNQSNFATTVPSSLPVLWLRGADDQIVSDSSLFDLGFLGQLGVVPGWPGAALYPTQPMVSQLRAVLDNFKAQGGNYEEVVLHECGHSPHIEKPQAVLKLFNEFVAKH